ncbi:MAG: hypothetical protein MUE73_05805 [Planctomycetes bacterium]|nr:hypothetical protein [Planctomycetota bacterium]
MKIPRFWARGSGTAAVPGRRPVTFTVWRWSDASEDDARRFAEESAARMAAKLAVGERLDRYSYGERPLREETIEELRGAGGGTAAVLTRNGYGALVLNAGRVLFADIDFPVDPAAGRRAAKEADACEARGLLALDAWSKAHPGFGLRVYRTFGGLRCLATTDLFDPADSSTLALLQSLGSDPLYTRLCRDQDCFRARLTPKPWRMGLGHPPGRWPFSDRRAEERHRDWEREYVAAARSFAVCRPLGHFGPDGPGADARIVLDAHDRLSGCHADLPLA